MDVGSVLNTWRLKGGDDIDIWTDMLTCRCTSVLTEVKADNEGVYDET